VEIDIKAGTQAADVISIKDRGITRLRGNGRGDLRVGIHVVTPTKLSAKEREVIENFARGRKQPEPALAQFHQGLFSKLRDRFFSV